MATIKVPYTYTEYPFSPMATKYSRRMAKNKIGTGVTVGMISFVLLAAVVGNLPFVKDDGAMSALGMLFVLVGCVFCGIYAEKYRNKWYKQRILKALEEDLSRMLPGQPELVKAQLEKLAAGIK